MIYLKLSFNGVLYSWQPDTWAAEYQLFIYFTYLYVYSEYHVIPNS
jgi:hypothetical protein